MFDKIVFQEEDAAEEPAEEGAEGAEGEGEAVAEGDGGPDLTPVLVYGIVADCLLIIPLIIFLAAGAGSGHALWIEATYLAWMPFGAVWILAMIDDGPVVREAMKGALGMASMGPWSTMWAGWMSFMMIAADSKALAGWVTILFAILYPCINIGLIAMEWHMAPGVIKWIQEAPFGELEDEVSGEGGEEEGEGEGEEEASELHTRW